LTDFQKNVIDSIKYWYKHAYIEKKLKICNIVENFDNIKLKLIKINSKLITLVDFDSFNNIPESQLDFPGESIPDSFTKKDNFHNYNSDTKSKIKKISKSINKKHFINYYNKIMKFWSNKIYHYKEYEKKWMKKKN